MRCLVRADHPAPRARDPRVCALVRAGGVRGAGTKFGRRQFQLAPVNPHIVGRTGRGSRATGLQARRALGSLGPCGPAALRVAAGCLHVPVALFTRSCQSLIGGGLAALVAAHCMLTLHVTPQRMRTSHAQLLG
jgi:hypothetical protein